MIRAEHVVVLTERQIELTAGDRRSEDRFKQGAVNDRLSIHHHDAVRRNRFALVIAVAPHGDVNLVGPIGQCRAECPGGTCDMSVVDQLGH